jgi:hypothetical protein
MGSAHAEGDNPEPVRANQYVLQIPQCSAADMMKADLDQIDAEKGLGRAGAVISGMEEAVRNSNATPTQDVADLELVVRKDGGQSLRVVWARQRRNQWEAFATSAEHIVTKDQIRFPDVTTGMKIVLRVESRMVYADGCPVRARGSEEGFTGAYSMGCGTRPIAAPSQGTTCGRRRGGSSTELRREVHARILSEARLPEPVPMAQQPSKT